jgi:hypothetical protein
VKSSSVVEGDLEKVLNLILDFDKKPMYDDTFEYGNVIE